MKTNKKHIQPKKSKANHPPGKHKYGNPPKSYTKGVPHITVAEAEEMFEYWANGVGGSPRPVYDVAKHFDRNRKTILKLKHDNDWDERFRDIKIRLQLETDARIAKTARKTKKTLRATFVKMAKAVLDERFQLEIHTIDGFEKITKQLIRLGKLLIELEGNNPEGRQRGKEFLDEALNDALSDLNDDELSTKIKSRMAILSALE